MTDQVLFISICSGQKNPGGTTGYNKVSSIVTKLRPETQNRLLALRDTIRSRLKNLEFDGFNIDDENDNLQKAEDFNGNPSETAQYLPAIERYNGRFYNSHSGLGVKNKNNQSGKDLIASKGYHLLILSALYGIVESAEPIQFYSCPIDHKSLDVQKLWRSSNILSDAIVDYIKFQSSNKNSQILRIYDLTAMKVYRDLVDWQYVRYKTGAEVVHCYHKKFAGDKGMEVFAAFFRDYLLQYSLQELLSLKLENEITFKEKDKFILSSSENPPSGFARESIGYDRDLTDFDKIIDQFESAYRAFRDAVSYLTKEDEKRMKESVDTGSKKIGNVLPKALQLYLNYQFDDYEQLIREYQSNQKNPPTREEIARLHYYRKIRNIAAHDYYSRIWELGGQIQYARMFLINRLGIHPGYLKDPYEVLKKKF